MTHEAILRRSHNPKIALVFCHLRMAAIGCHLHKIASSVSGESYVPHTVL